MFSIENVYLCVAANPSKDIDLDFIKWTLNPITHNVITTEGLVAEEHPDVLIRGLRDAIDLSAEMTMADWNTKFGCQTIFIPCTGELRHLSSSALRQLHERGGNYTKLVTDNIPEDCFLSYERWCKKRRPYGSIFCGKIGIGKSTFIRKRCLAPIDCDETIWQFFSSEEAAYYKKEIMAAVRSSDALRYRDLKSEMNSRINWSILFSKETNYEASALDQWLEYIPAHVLARFNVVELVVDEEVRKERLAKRGLDADTTAAFDNFYKTPAFVDEVIDIT